MAGIDTFSGDILVDCDVCGEECKLETLIKVDNEFFCHGCFKVVEEGPVGFGPFGVQKVDNDGVKAIKQEIPSNDVKEMLPIKSEDPKDPQEGKAGDVQDSNNNAAPDEAVNVNVEHTRIRRQSAPGNLVCHACGQSFKGLSGLSGHPISCAAIASMESKFSCRFCKLELPRSRAHLHEVECKHNIFKVDLAAEQKLRKKSNLKISCPSCQSEVKASNFRLHLSNCLPELKAHTAFSLKLTPPRPLAKKIACFYCKKTFANLFGLKTHAAFCSVINLVEGMEKCPFCKKDLPLSRCLVHKYQCKDNPERMSQAEFWKTTAKCPKCEKTFAGRSFQSHLSNCLETLRMCTAVSLRSNQGEATVQNQASN